MSDFRTQDVRTGGGRGINGATCRLCWDKIVSTHRHDFVTCSCGAISVDGGDAYYRWVGEPANFLPYDATPEMRIAGHAVIEPIAPTQQWRHLFVRTGAVVHVPNDHATGLGEHVRVEFLRVLSGTNGEEGEKTTILIAPNEQGGLDVGVVEVKRFRGGKEITTE